jgi:hypothetical protein
MNRYRQTRGNSPARKARLLAVAISALFVAQAGAFEVKMFAIGDFVPTASGGCGGKDISSWPNMVSEWYDKMGKKGHTKDGKFTNGSMTIQRFCDPDWNAGCNDDIDLDDADAAIIATHGSDSDDHWQGTMRGSWAGECRLDAGGTADNMNIGDLDLEFIHLSSCQSADDDNLNGIRFAMTDPVDGGFAHQWDGFHGLMWIGSRFFSDYKNFASDAHSGSIANAWVTNHYYDDDVGCDDEPCDDQCPVAYSISNTESSALSRLNNERYNNIYSDPTGNNWYAYMYMEGCNPDGETTFNP